MKKGKRLDQQSEPAKKINWRKWRRGAGILVAAFLLFGAGAAYGRGDFSLNISQNYSSQNSSLPDQLDYSSVDEVYQQLKNNYYSDLTVEQILNGLKHGLADSAGDRYTSYFTAEEAQQFDRDLNNTFSGIGARLGQDDQGSLVVESPLSGYPAEQAGLEPQDIVIKIDGKSSEGYTLTQAIDKIRGPSGSNVKLTVLRDKSKTLNFTITRQDITVPSVSTEVLPGNIGYVQIISFSSDTNRLIMQAADKLSSKNVKGVVLDMRNNPGGELDAAITVASQWLPDDTLIVEEKRGQAVIDSYRSRGDHPLKGIPTVVLINGGSASASEIVTAALHDNKAAYVMGEKSFGKGVVQQLIGFNDGGALKVTVAKWLRPNGENINKEGISPDEAVHSSKDGDKQKDAAVKHFQK